MPPSPHLARPVDGRVKVDGVVQSLANKAQRDLIAHCDVSEQQAHDLLSFGSKCVVSAYPKYLCTQSEVAVGVVKATRAKQHIGEDLTRSDLHLCQSHWLRLQ